MSKTSTRVRVAVPERAGLDPSFRRMSRFTALHPLRSGVRVHGQRSLPAVLANAEVLTLWSPSSTARLAAGTVEFGFRARFPRRARVNGPELVRVRSAFRRRERERPGARAFWARPPAAPFVRAGSLRHELDPSEPRAAATTSEPSRSSAARRLLQIDAKPEHAHERSVTPRAAGSRRYCGRPSRPAGGEQRSKPVPAGRVGPLEHAHGCAEAQAEPTTSTSCRCVQRRRCLEPITAGARAQAARDSTRERTSRRWGRGAFRSPEAEA